MEYLEAWFLSLTPLLRMFWICAGLSSAIFLVQTVFVFIGLSDIDMPDTTAHLDGDTLGAGGFLQLFSLRNIIYFLVGFGWSGVAWAKYVPYPLVAVLLAIVVGVAFVSLTLFVTRKMLSLESNGAFHIADCVGKVADVYLSIPEKGSGSGKIQISVHGSIHELNALSASGVLLTGAKVRVLEVIDGETLLVEAL